MADKSEDWGEPKAKDPTARFERIVNSAVGKLERYRDEMLPGVVNRPPGSKKVSREELLRDYAAIKSAPDFLKQRLVESVQQHGEVQGREFWMDWIEDMERG